MEEPFLFFPLFGIFRSSFRSGDFLESGERFSESEISLLFLFFFDGDRLLLLPGDTDVRFLEDLSETFVVPELDCNFLDAPLEVRAVSFDPSKVGDMKSLVSFALYIDFISFLG